MLSKIYEGLVKELKEPLIRQSTDTKADLTKGLVPMVQSFRVSKTGTYTFRVPEQDFSSPVNLGPGDSLVVTVQIEVT